MYEIRAQKDGLRKKYLEIRRSIDKMIKQQNDDKICKYITNLVSFRYCEVILMYAPLSEEVDIMPLAEIAWQMGKKIAFPLTNSKTSTMTYHYVTSLDELHKSNYGIREPKPTAPLYLGEEPSICIIPALLYDKDGFRLGYGKGYYDRYLNGYKGTKIGVIYSDFLTHRVPRGRFDRSVDVLISEKGVSITSEA